MPDTRIRSISDTITPEGTNLSIVKKNIPFQRRVGADNGVYRLYLEASPDYIPNVNQKVLIHHQDVASSSGLSSVINSQSTSAFIATFLGYTVKSDEYDNFNFRMDIKYDDPKMLNSNGFCRGVIEFDVSPTRYSILKPVESSVIVSELLPFDMEDGHNHLRGTSTGATQNTPIIAPMLFIDSDSGNLVFSNLFKSFNLPVTATERAEFTQSPLGIWAEDEEGDILWNGSRGTWAEDVVSGTVVHPTTGYTGMFYGTTYQHLGYDTLNSTYIDKILVIEIPQTQYGEVIDGKTLKVQIPKDGVTNFYDIYGAYKKNPVKYEAKLMDNYLSETDYSSSYFGNPPALSMASYESNVVLLFCDDIKQPNNDASQYWYEGHDAVMSGEKVYSPTSNDPKRFFDLFVDQAVGIAYLDRGFVVITNKAIVDAAYAQYYDSGNYTNVDIAANIIVNYEDGGVVIDRENSQFLWSYAYINPNNSRPIEFVSYNTEKSMNIVCLASAEEFYRTTNSTAKELMNQVDEDYATMKDPASGNLYPVIITEIGLHDASGNLLAIAKPTTPIKKYWYDVISFSVKIRL